MSYKNFLFPFGIVITSICAGALIWSYFTITGIQSANTWNNNMDPMTMEVPLGGVYIMVIFYIAILPMGALITIIGARLRSET